MVDQVSGMNNPWASAYSNGRSNNGRSNRNNVTTFDDFYSTMLAEDPQLTFAAEVGRQALPDAFGTAPIRRRQQDYLSGQFSNLYNQYRGNLARQMTTPGIRPSEFSSFADFLRDIPMATRYSQMTPSQRGVGTSRFAPRTRQIFF
jgi:hypothetical protein